jgi:hypothetical protein
MELVGLVRCGPYSDRQGCNQISSVGRSRARDRPGACTQKTETRPAQDRALRSWGTSEARRCFSSNANIHGSNPWTEKPRTHPRASARALLYYRTDLARSSACLKSDSGNASRRSKTSGRIRSRSVRARLFDLDPAQHRRGRAARDRPALRHH